MMDSEKKDQNRCSRIRDIVFFIPHILFPRQNLAPTLPTMHLDHEQLGVRFSCVVLVAANVAWSL